MAEPASAEQARESAPGEQQESAAPSSPEFADGIELPGLLRYALAHSPGLAAAREKALAAAQKSGYVGALPDPTLNLGWYAVPVQTRTGSQEFSIGVRQSFPWPGVLEAKREGAAKQGDRAIVRALIAERDLVTDIVDCYHELVYLHAASSVARALEEQARRLVQLSLSTDGPGKTAMPEQVRAETYLAELGYDRLTLGELIGVEADRMRGLIGLPGDAELGAPVALLPPALGMDLDQLQARATEGNLELQLAQLGVQAAEIDLERSKLEQRPGFSVGVRTIFTDARNVGGLGNNGQDPLLLDLGLSLPVRRDAKRAAIRERRHELRASVLEQGALADRLRGTVTRVWWEVRNAERLVELYGESLLPSAESAALASEELFRSGESGFESVIESIMRWHRFQLAALRARADHGQALAELERLLGAPLERSQREERP